MKNIRNLALATAMLYALPQEGHSQAISAVFGAASNHSHDSKSAVSMSPSMTKNAANILTAGFFLIPVVGFGGTAYLAGSHDRKRRRDKRELKL